MDEAPASGPMIAIAVGTLAACGVYLMLRARTFDLVLGLTLLSYAVNLFIFFMGRIRVDAAPIVDGARAATLASYADPLPQALVLTAIVISFGMTAVMLVIALRTESGQRSWTFCCFIKSIVNDQAIYIFFYNSKNCFLDDR